MREVNLTEGPIFQRLLRFSLPMIAGNLLQQVYNLVDALIVGKRLGADALASVGSAYTLMVFVTSVMIGLCMGSGAFVSADYGASDRERLKEDIRLSFWFILSVTVLIYLIVYPGMDLILDLLHTTEDLLKRTKEYVSVVFSSILFVFLYNFFSYLLRAAGNSVVPLIFLAISAALNIVLDLLFVLVIRMDVGGAALATVIAQAVAGVGIAAYSMVKLPLLRPDKNAKSWNWRRLKEIVLNDVATGVQQSVMNFGILMVQGLVNSFGATIMAAFAAAVKIDTFAYLPVQDFGNAYSTFVAQNFGAGNNARIREGTKKAFGLSAAFSIVLSGLVFAFAQPLMRVFVDASEAGVIAAGVRYLRIEGACYVGIGWLFLLYGYFRAVQKPGMSVVLTVISLGTRVALAYALAGVVGEVGIWAAIPIGWALADVVGGVKLCRGN